MPCGRNAFCKGRAFFTAVLNRVLQSPERTVVFMHGARNTPVHAMKEHRRQAEAKLPNLKSYIFYHEPLPTDELGQTCDFEEPLMSTRPGMP